MALTGSCTPGTISVLPVASSALKALRASSALLMKGVSVPATNPEIGIGLLYYASDNSVRQCPVMPASQRHAARKRSKPSATRSVSLAVGKWPLVGQSITVGLVGKVSTNGASAAAGKRLLAPPRKISTGQLTALALANRP